MNSTNDKKSIHWSVRRTQWLLYVTLASYFVVAPILGIYDGKYAISALVLILILLCVDLVLFGLNRRRRDQRGGPSR